MILVIDSDEIMAECVRWATGREARVARDVFAALDLINEGKVEMILLEPMLNGPDGFTLLNELASYADTAKIPVVLVSETDFGGAELGDYGVVGILNKETMRPEEVRAMVEEYARH